MQHREHVYADRRRRVSEVCKKYEDPTRWKPKVLPSYQFWINLNHSLALCLHAKVVYMSKYINLEFTYQILPVRLALPPGKGTF